jgi:hypothetical protein
VRHSLENNNRNHISDSDYSINQQEQTMTFPLGAIAHLSTESCRNSRFHCSSVAIARAFIKNTKGTSRRIQSEPFNDRKMTGNT